MTFPKIVMILIACFQIDFKVSEYSDCSGFLVLWAATKIVIVTSQSTISIPRHACTSGVNHPK